MKTPEDIKKGLECCSIDKVYCGMECPYMYECHFADKPRAYVKDALAYIKQLEDGIDRCYKLAKSSRAGGD